MLFSKVVKEHGKQSTSIRAKQRGVESNELMSYSQVAELGLIKEQPLGPE